MKPTTLVFAAFAATPFLFAQESERPSSPGTEMPNPKTPEHDVLKTFVGTWTTTMKSQGQESTGTEHCELICNGLWMKATVDGMHDGKPCQGLWLLGYDPMSKTYTGLFVGNQDDSSSPMKASWDAAKKTWAFEGQSPKGPFRSSLVWNDADTCTESVYSVAGDGKDTPMCEIVRKRASGKKPIDASANAGKPASPQHAVLAESVGTWDATVKTRIQDGSTIEEKATEKITPICDGRWYWSDFRGMMNGQTIEGHALSGYDTNAKKYVTYWIDSMNPKMSRTEGDWDASKKAFAMNGKCVDPTGQPMTIEQTATQGPDARTLKMTSKSPTMSHDMQIEYKRSK